MDSYPTLSLEDLVDFGDDPIANSDFQSYEMADQVTMASNQPGNAELVFLALDLASNR